MQITLETTISNARKLSDLRARINQQQEAASAELESVRAALAETAPEPFDEDSAIYAIAVAEARDALDGTSTVGTIRAQHERARRAAAAALAAFEKRRESLRTRERAAIAALRELSARDTEADRLIADEVREAGKRFIEAATARYREAAAALVSAAIDLTAAQALACEGDPDRRAFTLWSCGLRLPTPCDLDDVLPGVRLRDGTLLAADAHPLVRDRMDALMHDVFGD
ncbi:MAG: hypothetical protein ACOY5V_01115 [Pseudomonadota bacterium]